jgi:hypothetical protein
MATVWSFEFVAKKGKRYKVEAGGPEDIWVTSNDHPVKWMALEEQDQEMIRAHVEEHFFMVDAQKGWAES